LQTPLRIGSRRGIDLAPIDVATGRDVTLLHSFLWPGLIERETRLDAAIEAFLHAPTRPELVRGDYVDLLPGLLERRPASALTVVFQTASTGYLEQDRYDTLLASLDTAAGDGRPLSWVSSRRLEEKEHDAEDCWELELRIWPAPARLVALADFHGNWIDWVDAA
jgi:hypothetical protein